MKVLLTTLPREGEYDSWITPAVAEPREIRHLPLGILSLATNIWCDHEVVVLDPFSEYWTIEDTLARIEQEKPDVVGFSAVTRRIYSLTQMLKRVQAKWKIVGGPHATYYSQQLIEQGANAVFVGPLADNDLYWWLKNPHQGIINCTTDINEISFPRRHLMDYKHYFYEGGKVIFEAKNRMQMFSSVGCPNNCHFCSVQSRKVHRKLPHNVAIEMWHIKHLGCESVHLMDDNFNTSRNHVSEILDLLEASGWDMEWSFRGQVKFDLSLVPRMKKLGLKRVHVGIEALDDEILKWHGKNHRVEDIEKFCQVMRENEIDMLAYFIIGSPLETDDYMKRLPERIKTLGITQPYVNALFPQPDTQYYFELVKSGAYKSDIWADYMRNPAPNFRIPAPFGEEKKNRIMEYSSSIIKEFSGL
jgi:anaerobic magnesium-protoporphyrin IX monomethyl ester cyclase